MTPDWSLTYHLYKIKGIVCKKIEELKPYRRHMPMNLRKELIYSRAFFILAYDLQLYLWQSESVKDKLTAIYMRGNGAIYCNYLAYDTKNE